MRTCSVRKEFRAEAVRFAPADADRSAWHHDVTRGRGQADRVSPIPPAGSDHGICRDSAPRRRRFARKSRHRDGVCQRPYCAAAFRMAETALRSCVSKEERHSLALRARAICSNGNHMDVAKRTCADATARWKRESERSRRGGSSPHQRRRMQINGGWPSVKTAPPPSFFWPRQSAFLLSDRPCGQFPRRSRGRIFP